MTAKQQARRLGFAFAVFLIAVLLAQVIVLILFSKYLPGSTEEPWYPFLLAAIPNYLFGMPVFFWLTRKIPDSPKKRGERYTLLTVLRYAVIGVAISYVFAILGDLLNAPMVDRFGVDENMMEDLIRGSDQMSTLLFIVILAPVMEELLFRRRFLTKAIQFGKGNAVVAGGLAFGVFHLNIPQFVYATALGIFWGMVFVRHRSYGLVVVLHMITNAIGSVLMPWLAFEVTGGETIGGTFILLMIVLGMVLLFMDRKGFYHAMQKDEDTEAKPPSLVLNPGFIVYILIAVGVFFLAALGTQMLSQELISGIMKVG